MKYLCLGYHEDATWRAMSDEQRQSLVAENSAYQDLLKRNGHYLDGSALQECRTAATLRFDQGGKVSVTDGPFAETREQLGGYYLIEAPNLDEAMSIAERVPVAKLGTIEIRPVLEIAGLPGETN